MIVIDTGPVVAAANRKDEPRIAATYPGSVTVADLSRLAARFVGSRVDLLYAFSSGEADTVRAV